MAELHKYLTIQLRPVKDETVDQINYGIDPYGYTILDYPTIGVTSVLKAVALPMDNAARLAVYKETDYGMVFIPETDSVALWFAKLKSAQLKMMLEKYSEAIDLAMCSGEDADMVKAALLSDKIRFLSAYDPELPETVAEVELPEQAIKYKWVTCHQRWDKNDMGGFTCSGWKMEDGSDIPDDANMHEITGFVKIETKRGVLEMPAKATYKVRIEEPVKKWESLGVNVLVREAVEVLA
jgi:hypothetical protein